MVIEMFEVLSWDNTTTFELDFLGILKNVSDSRSPVECSIDMGLKYSHLYH